MGGIAGIFNFDGRPVEQEAIHRMTAAMRHRGTAKRAEVASRPFALW